MTNYKIINITDTVGKRDLKFNTTVSIEYVDSMMKKTIQLKPGETIFLQTGSLPMSVHKLRVKKLINVIEISNNELLNSIKPTNAPVVSPVAPVVPTIDTEEKVMTVSEKKKIGRKLHEVPES